MQLERVGDRIQGYVPAIDLDQIANLSQLVSGIYPELTETLKRTRPTGKIQDLILQADAGWQGLSVSGQLSHIRVNAWHDVPGVRDLNGEFWLTPTGGSARLQLANDAIDPARHFKEPIPIDRFSARLDWWQVAQGWVLYGQDLVLDNPDLSLASRFRLDLFEHPFLALTGRIDVKNAANADRYYPLQVMDKSLVDYLSGAIKGARPRALTCSGMANSATSLPQGRGHLPGGGAAAAGLLRILPRLATAHRPADRSVVPERQPRHEQPRHPARQGQLRLGARLDPGPLSGAHLYVDAKVEGEGKAISDYLQDSPLGGSVGQALREVEIRGPMKGSVKLDIPLDGESEVKASGDALFSNNKVRVTSLDLPLEQVQGRLEYDNEQTRFSNLKASLWNQPLTLDYQGRQQPNRYQVDLKFKGQWDSRRQRQDIPALDILKGRGNWAGSLGLTLPSDQPFSFQLALDSNLQGMGLDLPAPLAKAAGSRLPLKVTARGRDGSADIRAVLGPTWICRAGWCTATACPTSAGYGWTWGSPAPGCCATVPCCLPSTSSRPTWPAGWPVSSSGCRPARRRAAMRWWAPLSCRRSGGWTVVWPAPTSAAPTSRRCTSQWGRSIRPPR